MKLTLMHTRMQMKFSSKDKKIDEIELTSKIQLSRNKKKISNKKHSSTQKYFKP